jgi:putative addiction module antidote
MIKLKVTKVGESLAVALPPEVLASLNAIEGDTLYLTRTAEGYALSAPDPELQHQLRVARKLMAEHRDVLRALAKS